jgi:hypothetical protein
MKDPEQPKQSCTKSNAGGITVLDFKLNFRDIVIKTVMAQKTNTKTNGIE